MRYVIFEKSFFKIGQTWKKRQRLPKLANINQWDWELRANNEILLAEKRQCTLFSSILLNNTVGNHMTLCKPELLTNAVFMTVIGISHKEDFGY